MEQQAATAVQPAATAIRIVALEGISGKLRVEWPGAARTIEVRNGTLEAIGGNGSVDAVIAFDGEEAFREVFAGRKNPVVMALRGKLRVSGDLELATKVLLGLQAQGHKVGKVGNLGKPESES
jgi:SCP-2 sterol transfer family